MRLGNLPCRLKLHDLCFQGLGHPGDVLLARSRCQDRCSKGLWQVVLENLQGLHRGEHLLGEVLVEAQAHLLSDPLLLVEELVGCVLRSKLRDHVHACELEDVLVVPILILIGKIQVPDAVGQQPVLEGQSQNQRQSVPRPTVQQVTVSLIILLCLQRFRIPYQIRKWANELQAWCRDDVRADSLEQPIIPQSNFSGLQQREGAEQERHDEGSNNGRASAQR
mmetsp:Transcript_55044/g.103151  ORF Transcript_55044/g.103151 Transcript_55044/m.103151 type:complete len:222 (+) Transcript_55044:417-1082(+)